MLKCSFFFFFFVEVLLRKIKVFLLLLSSLHYGICTGWNKFLESSVIKDLSVCQDLPLLFHVRDVGLGAVVKIGKFMFLLGAFGDLAMDAREVF